MTSAQKAKAWDVAAQVLKTESILRPRYYGGDPDIYAYIVSNVIPSLRRRAAIIKRRGAGR